MLRGSKLMAFIATRDAARARRFYQEVLGLPVISEDAFAVVLDAHGTTLRLQKVEQLTPHPFTTLGWEVGDLAHILSDKFCDGLPFHREECMA
jgi:catechol 2,3-dioxygenase-like lactoylglutathione lyase family enzyme